MSTLKSCTQIQGRWFFRFTRGILQTHFPKSQIQIPNPANRNLVFGTRSDHENFSDGKLLWSERITKNQIPVVRAKYLRISAFAAVIGYFSRTSWVWDRDLGFGIWETSLKNPFTSSPNSIRNRYPLLVFCIVGLKVNLKDHFP